MLWVHIDVGLLDSKSRRGTGQVQLSAVLSTFETWPELTETGANQNV
jgi:hypothetical protein